MKYLLKFTFIICFQYAYNNSNANSSLSIELYASHLFSISSNYSDTEQDNLFDSLAYFRVENKIDSYCNTLLKLNKFSNKLSNSIFDSKLDSAYNFIIGYAKDNNLERARYILADRAFCYIKKSQYSRALIFFLEAHSSLKDKNNGDNLTPYIENELGSIYTRLGDYERAEFYYKFTEGYILRNEKVDLIPDIFDNIARMHMSRLEYSRALEYLTKVDALDSKNVDETLANYLNLIEVYLQMDSIQLAEKTITLCPPLLMSSKKKRLSQFRKLKARLFRKQGKYKEADKEYSKSILLFKEFNKNKYSREYSKLLLDVATNYFFLNKIDTADIVIGKALHFLNPSIDSLNHVENYQVYAENTFIDLLELRAEIYQKRFTGFNDYSSLELSLSYYELAIAANNKLRLNYLLNGSKLLSVIENKILIDKSIEASYLLYHKDKSQKYLNKVRRLVSQSKSILLLDDMAESEKIASLDESTKERIRFLNNQLYDLSANAKNSNLNNLNLDASYIRINEEIASLLEGGSEDSKSEFNDKKYVEYCLTSNNLYSINNFGDTLQFVKNCTSDSLLFYINYFNNSVSEHSNISDLNKMLNQFYNILFCDIKGIPKKITIISDDILSVFPFECLISNLSLSSYLIYNHEIIYALHYDQIRAIDKNVNYQDNFILIHSPTYKQVKVKQYASIERSELYYLDFSEEEVETLDLLFENASIISNEIDVKVLNEMLVGKNLYHYTGHAKVMGKHSYLSISEDEKAWIRDDEIARMKLNLELVTLSACETGLGKLNYGEGVQSIGRSFMTAGAKSVLYSLWTVNDKWTYELMGNFYKFLTNGDTKSNALRKAKIYHLKNSPPLERHPYYWAGFVMVGNENSLKTFGNNYFGLVAIGGILLFLLLVLILKKNKILIK